MGEEGRKALTWGVVNRRTCLLGMLSVSINNAATLPLTLELVLKLLHHRAYQCPVQPWVTGGLQRSPG